MLDDIKYQIDSFEKRFLELVLDLKRKVSKRSNLRALKSAITYLPLDVRKDHYEFIIKVSADLDNVKDIEDFFRHLNLYWSFLDYSLLELIIKKNSRVCGVKLIQDMQNFKRDVENFKERTTVKEFWDCHCVCGDSMEPPPHFERIVTKLNRHHFEYTLADLDQFRQKFCHKLNLRTFILTLVAFKDGSLYIIWHIPSSQVHLVTLAVSSTLVTISDELLYIEVNKWTWSCKTSGKLTLSEVH